MVFLADILTGKGDKNDIDILRDRGRSVAGKRGSGRWEVSDSDST